MKDVEVAIEHLSICGIPLLELIDEAEFVVQCRKRGRHISDIPRLGTAFVELCGVPARMDEMITAVIRTHADYMDVRAAAERLQIKYEEEHRCSGKHASTYGERFKVVCPYCKEITRSHYLGSCPSECRYAGNICEHCGKHILVGFDGPNKISAFPDDGCNKVAERWKEVAEKERERNKEEDWTPKWMELAFAEESPADRGIIGVAANDINEGRFVYECDIKLGSSKNKRHIGKDVRIIMFSAKMGEPSMAEHIIDSMHYAVAAPKAPKGGWSRIQHTTCPLCDTPDSMKSKHYRYCAECGLKLPHRQWYDLCARRDGETYMLKGDKI